MALNKVSEDNSKILLDWDKLEIGETFDTWEYIYTENMLTQFRKGVMDTDAAFPTVAQKYNKKYKDNGSVNARCSFFCYNSPIPGKNIIVKSWIADKYKKRGKTYIVTEAVSVDEDGRLIDRVITHELKQPSEVGKKWG
jgi:hypothetical protein